jgi:hypothetical protein
VSSRRSLRRTASAASIWGVRHILNPLTKVIILVPFAGFFLCACGTGFTPVTCTNQSGLTRTWSSLPSGTSSGLSGGSQSSTKGSIDKSAGPPPVDIKYPVLSAIAEGIDPVDAARQFGLLTIEDAGVPTPAQIATAQDPATYGWTCHPS